MGFNRGEGAFSRIYGKITVYKYKKSKLQNVSTYFSIHQSYVLPHQLRGHTALEQAGKEHES